MNKFAILVECDPGNTLGGSCLRDVDNMASYLINKCHFLPSNIHLLTTAQYKPKTIGVSQHISKDLFKVFDSLNNQKIDFLVVLLSGHGFSISDRNGDEVDGCDEAINVGFQIVDDDLYNNIVLKLKCNALLLADTCHSGTMFDLPYNYNEQLNTFSKNTKRNDIISPLIVSLSACSDQQLSMCDVGDYTGFGGSLTTAILNIDGVLENAINLNNFKVLHNQIQSRLSMLNQKLILSSSKQ